MDPGQARDDNNLHNISLLKSRRWTEPVRALGLLALWLMATLGLRPLTLPDEGRYANVAREMLHNADVFTPWLNGLPFFHKPPLWYWLDMLAMSAVGVNQFSARFGSFVGAWVMGAALFLAARRWYGPPTAIATLIVLATCPFLFVAGQYANLDMLVAGLMSATVLAWVRAVDQPQVAKRWVMMGWAFAALSVLAKGLIGLVLPILIVGPWLLAQARWRDVLRLLHPLGLLIFVLVAAPWFMVMQQRYPGFFDYFVIEQHFRRFVQSNFNNVRPVWFYILVLPLATIPWSLFLPQAIQKIWRERAGPYRWPLALSVWWIFVVVGFFSLPSSKLVGYVLPALAPWCLLLSTVAVQHRKAMAITACSAAVLCLAIVGTFAISHQVWGKPESSKFAAQKLAEQWVPGDRVVFVDQMYYDLPYYAKLTEPPIIASNWEDANIALKDNWRKELVDAARFAPARARELLWPIKRLPELVCHTHAVWFAAAPEWVSAQAGIPNLTLVHSDSTMKLWRSAPRSCSVHSEMNRHAPEISLHRQFPDQEI